VRRVKSKWGKYIKEREMNAVSECLPDLIISMGMMIGRRRMRMRCGNQIIGLPSI